MDRRIKSGDDDYWEIAHSLMAAMALSQSAWAANRAAT